MEENNCPEKKKRFCSVGVLQNSLCSCSEAMRIALVDLVFILFLIKAKMEFLFSVIRLRI